MTEIDMTEKLLYTQYIAEAELCGWSVSNSGFEAFKKLYAHRERWAGREESRAA